MATFKLGDRVKTTVDMHDHDDEDQPRTSKAGSVGEIVGIGRGQDVGQLIYEVIFDDGGCWVFYDQYDIDAGLLVPA